MWSRAEGSSGSRSTDSVKGAELQFFLHDRARFDIDELFRSTAEMLGMGRLGITYRVTLEAGPVIVVKRPRRDFTHTMQLLGKLRHENVIDLVDRVPHVLASSFACAWPAAPPNGLATHARAHLAHDTHDAQLPHGSRST